MTTCCQQTTTGNVTTAAPNGWATLCKCLIFLLLTTTNGRPKKRRRNKIRVDQLQTVVTQISNMSLTQFLSRVGVLSAMEQCQMCERFFRRKEDKKWYPAITNRNLFHEQQGPVLCGSCHRWEGDVCTLKEPHSDYASLCTCMSYYTYTLYIGTVSGLVEL